MALTRVAVGGNGEGGSSSTVPGPSGTGQVLVSLDGINWIAARPVVSGADGWLSNADGDLLIEGWF